jgi:multiple sugar transport system ATP-binding protein
MASVTFENVSKYFVDRRRRVCAVRGLDLSILDHELVVLLGPSGCGKTTTLRMVAGLEKQSGGSIRIGDRIVDDLPPRDRDVAMVFQNHALYPHMTVSENLGFGLKMRRVPSADARDRILRAADMLGITALLDRRPAALSGGECQRVALGRALVRAPRVFLFDEPLSNLDAAMRIRVRSEIKQLQRNFQITTLYVTHDQEEAMTLGDRLVVMRDGVVQQIGTAMDVYDRPANRFVAEFVGVPHMNFLTGTVTCDSGSFALAGSFGRIKLPTTTFGVLESARRAPIVMGFRPEHIELASVESAQRERPSEVLRLGPVRVLWTEFLGDRTIVYVETEGREALAARAPGDFSVKPDDVVHAHICPSRLHFFQDSPSGERLAETVNAA